ncbi:MAG: L,D-transpeptidase family protein [Candidatus Omnitrophota bacterium]
MPIRTRVYAACLFFCFAASPASARLMVLEQPRQILLADLADVRSGHYAEAFNYSRFPKADKKLRILPFPQRDPFSRLYARDRVSTYRVQPNDTLGRIARWHGTTVEFIKSLNKLKSGRLKTGQELLVWDQPFTIEVSKMFNRLYLRSGEILVKEYPVSTGKSTDLTPIGTFIIQSRYPYPTWFHKGKVVPGGAPDNFLGTRWLGFDRPQYGIHGTIFPELIGQSVSKGCIRMKNEDIEELYEFISVGTMVVIK